MQKKQLTKSWKQAVAEVVTNHEPRTVLRGLPDDNPSQEELKKLCGTSHKSPRGSRTVLLCNEKGLSLCCDYVNVHRRGAKYFQKTERSFIVRIFGNRMTVDTDYFDLYCMRILFGLFGVKDWRQIPRTEENAHKVLVDPDRESDKLAFILKHNTSLLKDVLTGRVWSDESLYKRMASSSYKLKNFPWKLFREYFEKRGSYNWISIADLAAFTSPVETSMRQWLAREADRTLMRDCVCDAILDRTTVDLKHSTLRLNEDHLAAVRRRMQEEIARKEQTPLFADADQDEDGISLLNSELEIYKEGLEMGHCIYTNYFQSIKNRRYLGFSMHTPERCTFGVVRTQTDGKPSLRLDQIQLRYNRTPSEESRSKAETFIKKHASALLNLFAPIQTPTAMPAPFGNDMPYDDDLPY